ncbi:hypothetical protein XFLAVUS301_01130 [Xanthobacter flavus]|uniref:Uncharacterized protein n=1 Tax=Xanthobacter flavus TaxID=281 RepID=A0A9W6CJK3_XANFL|nr:hypothetical protein XFLAVUS301_01130 [Xanthobacter flavus]
MGRPARRGRRARAARCDQTCAREAGRTQAEAHDGDDNLRDCSLGHANVRDCQRRQAGAKACRAQDCRTEAGFDAGRRRAGATCHGSRPTQGRRDAESGCALWHLAEVPRP